MDCVFRVAGASSAVRLVYIMAPRMPIPLREIVYTLSPYQQEVMKQGIEKLPGKAMKFIKRVSGDGCDASGATACNWGL